MPSLNSFRRPLADRLTLRQRAADLKAGLGRAISKPAVAAEPAGTAAEPDALVAEIFAHWPVWAAEQRDYDTSHAERVEERRFALIQAAEDLPATQKNIAAKALALAWLGPHGRRHRPRGRRGR
jgi:hypothetical protein